MSLFGEKGNVKALLKFLQYAMHILLFSCVSRVTLEVEIAVVHKLHEECFQ